jgi:hypothetical protein
MNNIIIIGNGFDLAHGLKTGYRDFIDYLWEKMKTEAILSLSQHHEYNGEDVLIKCPCHLLSPSNLMSLDSLLNQINCEKGYDWFKKLTDLFKDYAKEIKIIYKNSFIKEITEKKQLQNWVDIEYEYYIELKKCLIDEKNRDIEKLNKEFLELQRALELYLIEQQNKQDIKILPEIKEKIQSIMKNSSNDTLFLNFNYTTKTEHLYFNCFDIKPNCIHIHGELENHNNPIIFGYGDEMDDENTYIETQNDNRYLEYRKSIKYLETRNYQEFLSFMCLGGYNVFIMGHSCGISDRTLLNTLFEHDNCKSIKLFYYKYGEWDNYRDLIKNVSRHFTDKRLLRKLVVNKEDTEPLSL